ncbi:Glutamine--tRNA ligase [Rhynchospora pubera]|uniref:glutamine--tRNA ligase n=1 Tax=Rhynchospora pubera TaxID=906938 RepID=A0AAV8DGE7_9POAL|nr:Glutamine--tRNA ligase [Rhynchospora pubera]
MVVVVVEGGDSPATEKLELFLSIGLDRRTAENALVNPKVTSNLVAVIEEAGVKGSSKTIGNLLYTVATKYPTNALLHRPVLIKYIISSKIKNSAQLDAALSFLSSIGSDSFDFKNFEEVSGVGVEVSIEEIKSTIEAVLEENMKSILELRYHINVGNLCGQVRKRHPWADAKLIKELIENNLPPILGEKTDADKEPMKKKKGKPVKFEDKTEAIVASSLLSEEEENPFSIFPNPEENIKVHTEIFFSDGNIWRAYNTKERLEQHLKATGGKVFTRFPPEPNGYLHIGHAKALYIDFGLAREKDGVCYLRFDDTNPVAERMEYIEHIKEIIEWMGWKPFKVTYTSDYFDHLYELAVELIKMGLAYVDHQTPEEIKEYREKMINSPWRDRPIEESLKLFDEMKRGMIEEGKATLRLKQDMQNNNKNMCDLIAYRIKFSTHPKAGDKWHIYPSYDYSHCIVDSLENITHSLCSLEFEIRRPSYYWLLLVLGLYQPHVWEYSRLNVSNTVMSKRKLNRLVTEKWVDSWDDPRLMTLAGLRRRGVSSTSINAFIRRVGITRSDNSMISSDRLDYHIREELNKTAPRTMVVLHPLKVIITNLDKESILYLDARMWPHAPSDDASSYYNVPFTRVVYIESSDFRLKDSKDYYGLAPGKSVLLKYAFPIRCTEVIYGENLDTVVEVHAEYELVKETKPKGVLHWVAEPSPGAEPLKVEVRLFEKLFHSENPSELEDWLGDLNPHSKEIINDAYAVPSLAGASIGDKFQFERLGYFAVDLDSTDKKLVFNRTVTLRDSFSKGGSSKPVK